MLIRRPGQPWHPLQPALHDERALQTLLVQSPSLLPSPGPGELAVAANFRIGSTASVDLLGVGVDGRIVLVECGHLSLTPRQLQIASELFGVPQHLLLQPVTIVLDPPEEQVENRRDAGQR